MLEREITLPWYRVLVAPGALDRVGEIARGTAPAHRYAIVTDDNVGPTYAGRVRSTIGDDRCAVFTVPSGETHKTRDTWARLTDELLSAGYGRDSALVALGGGVIGDLAGFVAATFMRGIPFVQVPTTLLAMIDASIGGKTGVDTPAGKNLVGAFHQPAAVVADPRVLRTLPREHLRAGLAEAIKHGVIADEAYFDMVSLVAAGLEATDLAGDAMIALIARSIEIKADVVRRDEREAGVRKVLNFGHTIGHAVEMLSGYTLLHGAAIGIGMCCESALAEHLGMAEPRVSARVWSAVVAAGLPARVPASVSIDDVIAATYADKKSRRGRVEYALPARIGAMAGADRGWSVPVDDATVRAVVSGLRGEATA
jgi:3-dehydroquinate synthase